jgi:hypothetical protein
MHLSRYTQPAHQRYIIRILFMVPVYAVCSWISLLDRSAGIYLDTIRDCYESWVIYNFLALCLAYVGGAGNVANRADGREVEPSWLTGTCCLPPLPVDGAYVKACKRGALQFVIVKPVLAALTLTLVWAGVYGDQEIRGDVAYPYIAFIYNVSYTAALYALLLFYLGAHDLLEPFNPLLKFVLVKSVIFLTFWQSILCAALVSRGALRDGEDGRALQNVLICCEMIVASSLMLYAFPSAPYTSDGGVGALGVLRGAAHAIAVDDVVSDTVHQFAPTYQEYVLHGSEGGAPRKIRMKTHVMMGQEMRDARRWNGGDGPLGAHRARRVAAGAPPRGTGARSERLDAGMLANAGFENSYGEREVEDDLEDDFGQEVGWDSGSDDGAGNATRGGARGRPERAPSLSPLPDMAPLPSEARRGGATVFDAVVDLTRGPASVERAHRAPGTSEASLQASPLPAPFLVVDPEPRGGHEAFATGAASAVAPIAPPPSFRPAPSLAPPPGHDFASFKVAPPKSGDDAA